MSKNRNDYMKDYRKKKIDEDPNYRLLENEKKRISYFNKKGPKENNTKDDLRKIFESIKTPKGNNYRDITINNYISKINKILMLLDKKDFNIDYFLDPDNVINKLKDKYDNYKDYISPISKLLKYYNKDDDIIKKYLEHMSDEKTKQDKKRGDNKMDKDEKKNFMTLKEIDKKIDDYEVDNNSDKLTYKLIVSFYFKNVDNFIPRNDLNIMKLINVSKIKGLNEDYNYIVNDKGTPKQIIMCNYKTSTTYGKQKFGISNYLSKLIKEYYDEMDRNNGDYLFLNKRNEPYDKSSFLRLIKESMKNVLGKDISVDLARSILITDFYSGKIKSINEKSEFAKKMLHSSNVAEEYVKIE